MKKWLLVLVCVMLSGLIYGGVALGEELALRGVCFLPKNHPLAAQTVVWVDEINKAMAGKVKINYVGGPEVIPGMQQAEALRNGVIDVAFVPTAYYQNMFPEGVAFTLSKLSPAEERAPGGFYDLMVERHKKVVNAMYLGRWLWSPFYLWTKTEVKTPADLKGQKMRTSALYDRFMQKLGIAPVTIPSSDTYTALERGTVDGFGFPLMGPGKQGWTKVVKYIIDHPFYNQNCTILLNLDKWNKIPAEDQKKILEITAAYEPKMVEYFKKANDAEWADLEKDGVKKIVFSPEDAKAYLNMAYDVEWEALSKKVPDLVEKLKQTTGN